MILSSRYLVCKDPWSNYVNKHSKTPPLLLSISFCFFCFWKVSSVILYWIYALIILSSAHHNSQPPSFDFPKHCQGRTQVQIFQKKKNLKTLIFQIFVYILHVAPLKFLKISFNFSKLHVYFTYRPQEKFSRSATEHCNYFFCNKPHISIVHWWCQLWLTSEKI